MKPLLRRLPLITLGLMLGAVALGLFFARNPTPSAPTAAVATATETATFAPKPAESPASVNPSAVTPTPARREIALPPPDPAVYAVIGTLLADLKKGPIERSQLLARLKALKASIHALPPDVAAATLIAWLDSGADAPTRLSFVVGAEGVMDESPTFRTALLDLLGQTDPVASLGYSQDLLAAKPGPEEYALALRNLAWLNPDGAQTALIRQSFLALLTDPALSEQPTPGYLESFDVAVAVANADLVRALLANQSTQLGNDVLSRTTFIALDRIMLRTPEAILDAFAADPRFLADQPNWRASLLARLDPSNPEHVEQLRNYLLKTPHAETELGYFASIYPLANFFEGNRLVTGWETVNQAQTIPERDAAARKLMEGLLAEPGFKGVAPSIETILQRVSPPTATPPASAAPPVSLMPAL
jgi:hypothetical protein